MIGPDQGMLQQRVEEERDHRRQRQIQADPGVLGVTVKMHIGDIIVVNVPHDLSTGNVYQIQLCENDAGSRYLQVTDVNFKNQAFVIDVEVIE